MFALWLILLSMPLSRSIHVVANDRFLLLYGCVILHFTYISQFLYSSVSGHLGCFHILTILNNYAVNIRIHVSFWECGEKETLLHHWWEFKRVQPLKKNSVEFPRKIKNATTIWSNNSILAVYLKKTKYQLIFFFYPTLNVCQ